MLLSWKSRKAVLSINDGGSVIPSARRHSRRALIVLACLTSTLLPVMRSGIAQASVGEVIQLNAFGAQTVAGQYGVAVDQNTGNVYLGNKEVTEGPNAGSFLFQFSPEETTSLEAVPTNVGSEGGADGQFRGVSGLAVDAGSSPSALYAIDVENHRIERLNGKTLAYESQFPITTSAEVGLAVDSAGTLYLPNPGGNEVQELTSMGAPGPVPTIKGSGSNELVEPTKVAVDAGGNIYIVDHPGGIGRVEKFTPSGEFSAVTDVANSQAVAVDPSNGDVWVVDGTPGEEEMIRVFDSGGTLIAETTSPAVLGFGANVRNIAVYGATHEAFATVAGLGHMARLGMPVASRPSVDAQSVSSTTQTHASAQAEINPNSVATFFQFQFGLTNGYGFVSPVIPGLIGSDAVDHAVSADLAGLAPNTVYFYHVIADNGLGETEGSKETFLTEPETPVTGPAAGLSKTEATIVGALNPGGHDTRYYFEYGTTTCNANSCGTRTGEEDAGSGTGTVEIQATLTNLIPLTVYHYRLVVTNSASNGGGTANGPEGEFLTPSDPVATTDPPIEVGVNSAEVSGTLIPNGAATSYRFEYGVTSAYGLSIPAPDGDVPSSKGSDVVTVRIEGLAPDTEYHYRLASSNDVGTSVGREQTFRTDAAGEANVGTLPPGFAFTGAAPSGPVALVFPTLTGLVPRPPAIATKAKPLTRTQKRAAQPKRLKRCRTQKARPARQCERSARRPKGAGQRG